MYCPKCRTENPDQAKFCSACGAVLTPAPPAPPESPESIMPKTSGLAIAALVLGLLSILLGFLTGLPAIILGIIALVKIEKSGGRITGKGFAVTGIVVPVFSIALTMLILLPVLSRTRAQAKRAVCSSNLRQLSLAWTIYADDYDDHITNGAAGQQRANELPWTGRDWSLDNSSSQLLTESEQIQAIKSGALWRYCPYEKIYRCPTGLSEHLRTYSIVDSMNGIAREGTEEEQGVYIKRRTQIRQPASRIVFIDTGCAIPETYAVYYNQQKWWDQPPVRHDDGTTVSFADGHSEYWRWMGKETIEHGKTAAGIYNPNAIDHWSPQTPTDIEDLHKTQRGTWGRLGYYLSY